MQENSYQQDKEDLQALLQRYDNLATGRQTSLFSEEEFESIIDYYDDRNEIKKSLEVAEMGLRHFPYSSLMMIKKADCLLVLGRYDESLAILDKVELMDSGNIFLYVLKTDVYLALQQHEQAVDMLNKSINMFDGEDKIDLLFELTDVYDDYEEFDKVVDCLKLILEMDPENEEALYRICFWFDYTERNEESIEFHQKIIDEFPYCELAWFNQATAFHGMRLYEKAIDCYKMAIIINDKFDFAYRNLADAYIRVRKYKDAIEAMQKVLEITKPEDVICEAIGYCYEKMKFYAQSRFYYKKAYHLNPEYHQYIYKIAHTYYKEQAWEECLRQLETLIAKAKFNAKYYLLLGECYMELEQYKDAVNNFADVVRLQPKIVAGWEGLIKSLYCLGNYQEAMEYLHAIENLMPEKNIFLFYQALVHWAWGKKKEAYLLFETALLKNTRFVKKIVSFEPAILQDTKIASLIATYKKSL